MIALHSRARASAREGQLQNSPAHSLCWCARAHFQTTLSHWVTHLEAHTPCIQTASERFAAEPQSSSALSARCKPIARRITTKLRSLRSAHAQATAHNFKDESVQAYFGPAALAALARADGAFAKLPPPKPSRSGRPFDFGPRGNFGKVFGRHPFLWLLPTNQGIEGNGIFFELSEKGVGGGEDGAGSRGSVFWSVVAVPGCDCLLSRVQW